MILLDCETYCSKTSTNSNDSAKVALTRADHSPLCSLTNHARMVQDYLSTHIIAVRNHYLPLMPVMKIIMIDKDKA